MVERRRQRSSGPNDGERRREDRRESPRIPMQFLLRDIEEGGAYVERRGDLSLGGIYWTGEFPPYGKDVEVRFRLPGVPREIRGTGEIIRLKEEGEKLHFHVRFTELPVDAELAIARALETARR